VTPSDVTAGGRPPRSPRAAVGAHPIAAFLVLVFAVTGLLAVLPFDGVLYGPAENILGAAVPAAGFHRRTCGCR
jgi:hypothetical protein